MGWTRAPCPARWPARLSDFPWLDPEEWWEIPDRGLLARKVREHYPDCIPVVGEDGALRDVILPGQSGERAQEERSKAERDKAERSEEAARRGYKNTACLRPKNIFRFLRDGCTEPSQETEGASGKGKPENEEEEKLSWKTLRRC